MGIKEILTVVTPQSVAADALAIAVARACEAHVTLTAVASAAMTPVFAAGHLPPGMITKAETMARKQAEEAGARFDEAARAANVPLDVVIVQDLLDRTGDELKRRAHVSDLVVIEQSGDDPAHGEEFLLEALLFGSGKPLLIAPAGHERPVRLGKMLIAWNDSATAARAVGDAMPVLAIADQVEIVTIAENGESFSDSGNALSQHLGRHGITATHRPLDGQGRPTGEVIDAHARASGADLVVMGAYGRSRFREFVLGGATRSILTHMSVPVLMAH